MRHYIRRLNLASGGECDMIRKPEQQADKYLVTPCIAHV